MSTITIKAVNYDGNSYTFNKENAIVESDSKGISIGDRVRIVHNGKIDDGTEISYMATSIKKLTTVTDNVPTESNQTENNNSVTGVITYAAGSIIKIKAEDGNEYEFQTVGAKKELSSKGIVEGETITVKFDSELSTTNTNKATDIIYVKD